LDFAKRQTLVIELTNSDHGDPRIGFLVENTIYFAHEFRVNNVLTAAPQGDMNLDVVDGTSRFPTGVQRTVGLLDPAGPGGGIFLKHQIDNSDDPNLIVNYSLQSSVAYTVGADNKDFRRPFTAGNENAYVTVNSLSIFLFSIRPKNLFPIGPVLNKTLYSLDYISISTRSADSQAAAFIKVIWYPGLSGEVYGDVSQYSALEVNTTLTGENFTESIVIATIPVTANKTLIVKKEDLFTEYENNFSQNATSFAFEFTAISLSDQQKGTLGFFADLMDGSANIDVSINIKGGEIG